MLDQENSASSVQNEQASKSLEKAGKASKSKRVLDGATELYRHYDAWGRLLYVGVSLSSLARLASHRDCCAWFDLIKMVTIARYPNRAEALKAERKAIENETPYFNRMLRRGWRDVKWSPLAVRTRAADELSHLLRTISAHEQKTKTRAKSDQ